MEALRLPFGGFVSDAPLDNELFASRGPWLGPCEALSSLDSQDYVIAIGDGRVRRKLSQLADRHGHRAITLIHPAAIIGRHGVTIGEGSVICAQSIITTDVRIGRHVHLNRAAQVGHDSRVGDFSTLHPGAILSGNVTLDEGTTVGTNAAIVPGKSVGAWTVIGAGAAVVAELPSNVTAVGVPAKPR